MKLGEVCLLTDDVVRLANFYKQLLGTDNGSSDSIHQTIIAEETMLTVYNDGEPRPQTANHIQLAFTVEDVDREYERLCAMGAVIVSPPASQPWGARNMCFLDPDGNRIFLRCFPRKSR